MKSKNGIESRSLLRKCHRCCKIQHALLPRAKLAHTRAQTSRFWSTRALTVELRSFGNMALLLLLVAVTEWIILRVLVLTGLLPPPHGSKRARNIPSTSRIIECRSFVTLCCRFYRLCSCYIPSACCVIECCSFIAFCSWFSRLCSCYIPSTRCVIECCSFVTCCRRFCRLRSRNIPGARCVIERCSFITFR